MAKNGILPCRGDMWGPGGTAQLDSLDLPAAYFDRIAVLRDLVEIYDREILFLDRDIHRILYDDAGYSAVRPSCGVGSIFTAVFVAEIGDVTRFGSPEPCAREPDSPPNTKSPTPTVHVRRGRITKRGSRLAADDH